MDKVDVILNNPNTPGWMVEAIKRCLTRDPIQAANEATFLAAALRERAMTYVSR